MRRAEIVQLLPSVFRRTALPGSPLAAVLEAAEALHAPSEAALDDLDAYLDPQRAPDAFVVYLAHWVGLGWLVDSAAVRAALLLDGTLRDLVAAGASLARMRGTRDGLRAFLRLATGGHEFDVVAARDGDGRERAFAISVVAPAELEPRRALLLTILRHEKPVYAQCELRFGADGPPVPVGAAAGARGATPEPRPAGPTAGPAGPSDLTA